MAGLGGGGRGGVEMLECKAMLMDFKSNLIAEKVICRWEAIQFGLEKFDALNIQDTMLTNVTQII